MHQACPYNLTFLSKYASNTFQRPFSPYLDRQDLPLQYQIPSSIVVILLATHITHKTCVQTKECCVLFYPFFDSLFGYFKECIDEMLWHHPMYYSKICTCNLFTRRKMKIFLHHAHAFCTSRSMPHFFIAFGFTQLIVGFYLL